MRKIVLTLFFVLLAAFLSMPVCSACSAKPPKARKSYYMIFITKRVKDPNDPTLVGKGIKGADIILIIEGDTLRDKSTYDMTYFKDLTVGSKGTLIVSKEGYQTVTREVEVLENPIYDDVLIFPVGMEQDRPN